MTQALQSYAEGRWQDGTGEQRPLLDAATGEVVATIPARGPDAAAMLRYARTVGGPALRELTFTQRAAILKGLARHLSGCLDELAALSARTGATRRDTAVDVDGDLVGRLAPWHGRILVLDRTDAAESTGHGVAMPQMLHGGPGRAGGGEELGGLRAVQHYLQRTAVQGHPDLLATLVPDGTQGTEGKR